MPHLSVQRETCDANLFEELEKTLAQRGIDKMEVCIVGSTCLAVRGLRTHGDIDVCDNPELTQSTPFGGDRYEVLGISDRELFNNPQLTDKIEGWKIVRPEIEYCYKKQRRRDKDKQDVPLLEEYKMTSDEWNHQLESEYCLSTSTILWKNFCRSLRQDGLIATASRAIKYFVKR